MPSTVSRTCFALLSALAISGCEENPFPLFVEEEDLRAMTNLGTPLVDRTNRYVLNEDARALGADLFADPTLSSCGTVSCKSCHEPEQGFTYNLGAGAPGCDGNETARNPPTLLNVSDNKWFMWDGRGDRLWSQAVLPYLSPQEMAGSATHLKQKLAAAPYAERYEALFGANAEVHSDAQVLANFGKALAAFEWTLRRTTSPFDRALASYLEAVETGTEESHPQHLGFKTFLRKGKCAVCHKGAALTDHDFHNVGVADDTLGRGGRLDGIPQVLASEFNALGEYSDLTSGSDAIDANRLRQLQIFFDSESERAAAEALGQLEGAFKTPTLRNVALTAPYMHNGSLATLADVVDFYDRGGDPADSFAGTLAPTIQPLSLTAEEKAALIELLEMMTGDTGP